LWHFHISMYWFYPVFCLFVLPVHTPSSNNKKKVMMSLSGLKRCETSTVLFLTPQFPPPFCFSSCTSAIRLILEELQRRMYFPAYVTK
jgi:hypothetical protein